MLRLKPTRIALTEDDLCYHIDSIFHRNPDLAVWHQKRKSSGNSYDGDEDDEDVFRDSDSCSILETPPESECDDTQSQTLAGDDQQETEPRERNTTTSSPGIGHYHESRPVNVRFAAPELSHSSPDGNSRAVIRSERAIIGPAESAHSLHRALQQIALSSANWNIVRGVPCSQHNHPWPHPLFLSLPSSAEVTLDTNLASLFSSVIALPLRLSQRQDELKSSDNSSRNRNCRKSSLPSNRLAHDLPMSLNAESPPAIEPFDPGSTSDLPKIRLILRPTSTSLEMKRIQSKELASTARKSRRLKSREVHTPEPRDQDVLTARASNSGSTAFQSSSKSAGPSSVRGRSGALTQKVSTKLDLSYAMKLTSTKATEGNQSEGTKDVGRLVDSTTISRATQTEPDPETSMKHAKDGRSVDDLLLGWQDPFISAMFPEPDPPAYDATSRIRRGMQGYIEPSTARRGFAARNDRIELAQLVHPTLVDARLYHEYVHRLIAEIDRDSSR
ncbi:CDC26 family anaphase-promoting complex subunit [Aspergillus mulundensis]|uniref:Uncharacterized protein n=1 Tax=Aspergillus mulundensis TaxID=1810919 RepID=A0A3D8SKJ6_9EURO|nr:hypothetical protein DSM5745_03475 [Aspergillus mulundensis]RDW86833.1 hypothetical protein DSM5745_03475 [Aspergillus mulundensis]